MIIAQEADEIPPAIPSSLQGYVYLDCLQDKSYVLANIVTRQKVEIPRGNYELVWNELGTSFQVIGITEEGEDYYCDEEEMNQTQHSKIDLGTFGIPKPHEHPETNPTFVFSSSVIVIYVSAQCIYNIL